MPENETHVPTQLSDGVLGKAAEAFTRLRGVGAKALFRFAYDRSMPGTHRYSAETIVGHVEQLQPVMAQNSDALYVLQAGFIGSWGEWHSEIVPIHTNVRAATTTSFWTPILRICQRHAAPCAPRDMLYAVPMLTGCCLAVAIRCCVRFTGGTQATAVTAIVEAELYTLLPADRKLNVRVPVYKLSGALRRRMSGEPSRPQLHCGPSMAGRCECKGAYGGISASSCRALGCCFETCDGCPECYVGFLSSRPIVADNTDRMAFGVAAESKSNTAVARIGFDNDGFMSTSTDGGTWGAQYTRQSWDENADGDSAPFPAMGGSETGSLSTPTFGTEHGPMADRSFEYAAKESAFVPVDGEMFWRAGATPYDSGWPAHISAETAAWRLREMHYSTLSLVHGFSGLDGTPSTRKSKNETIDRWMQAPLDVARLAQDRLPLSMSYALGRNHTGFEYVRDHLGYRLELQSASFPGSVTLEAPSDLTVTIPHFTAAVVNYGFAAPINPRPVYLALLTPDGSRVLWTGSGWPEVNETTMSLADVRDWQPFTPGDPTYSPLAHPLGGQNITLYSTHNPNSPIGPKPPPCLADKAGCFLPLALFLPDLRLRKCIACDHAAAFSIVFANDAQTMNVSTVPGTGRFNIVGKVHVGLA